MASRRRTGPWRVPPFVGLSVLGHGFIFLFLAAAGLGRGCAGIDGKAAFAPEMMPSVGAGARADELDLVCLTNELVATGGRALACLAPGLRGTPPCEDDAWARIAFAADACLLVKPIDVTLIDPEILSPFANRPDERQLEEERKAKLEEQRKPEEDPDKLGQVVDIAQPSAEIRP